jgi:hypothetical protein
MVSTPLTLAVDRSIHSDRILRNLSHVWLMSVAISCMFYSDKKINLYVYESHEILVLCNTSFSCMPDSQCKSLGI